MAKLLVVDDEPEVCETFSAALTAAGFSVKTCLSGNAAIELYRRQRADVIFCDLKLPGMDGLEVLGAVKGIDPMATVVMVTAYGSVETATHALRLGAYDFVEKPCTIAQIQQIAQRAVSHRRQLCQLSLVQNGVGPAAPMPARLTELEQLQTDFLKLVIEELRSPLRLLSETLMLARNGFYGPWDEATKQAFLTQCNRVENLLSRTITGAIGLFLTQEQQVTPMTVNVENLLHPLMADVRRRALEKRLEFKASWPALPLVGTTDPEKVTLLVQELLDNALAYTSHGGCIEFTLEPHGLEGFQILVKDTGCGISEEERPWLFTSANRLPRIHPKHRKSTGIGLILVRHTLNLLNGTITLESQPGLGSCFTVTLPLVGSDYLG